MNFLFGGIEDERFTFKMYVLLKNELLIKIQAKGTNQRKNYRVLWWKKAEEKSMLFRMTYDVN